MPAPHRKPQLTRTKQHNGWKKRKEKVENAEYQRRRQKFLALELRKSNEHRITPAISGLYHAPIGSAGL